jgi:hypothetical protein
LILKRRVTIIRECDTFFKIIDQMKL